MSMCMDTLEIMMQQLTATVEQVASSIQLLATRLVPSKLRPQPHGSRPSPPLWMLAKQMHRVEEPFRNEFGRCRYGNLANDNDLFEDDLD